MRAHHPIRLLLIAALAIMLGGGCLCWLTGNCDEKLTPPSNPTPANGAVDQPTSVTLSWEGGNSPAGRTIRQDVYLGTSNPPLLYKPSVAGRSLTIDSLSLARTYYWRVILIDEDGRNVIGPIWSFTTVYPPAYMAVIYPNWATSWSRGESRTIQWRSGYAGSQVRLDLYKAGFNLCSITEATHNDGYYDWELTSCADKSDPDYRIKVTSLLDENLYDFSDFFTVELPCPIEVTVPRERELWVTGEARTIQWQPLGLGTNIKVGLHLYRGSDYQYIIAANTPDDGSFDWVVNDYGGGSGPDYRVRISDLNEFNCSQFSDFFSVQACTVRVTSPAVNDIWPLQSQHSITWDPIHLPEAVVLELYHNGDFVCVLDPAAPNTGAYLWTVTRCDSPYGERFQIKVHGGPDGSCGFSGRFNLH
ncbi:MAG TPA: hypothetical protein VNN55_10960 [bacterium]|nr:hypothetical protein [bacterium]